MTRSSRRGRASPRSSRSSGRSPSRARCASSSKTDLRALTDAEQDSKELKSAKRHLLFDRIVETVELPFPVGPVPEGEARGQGLADQELRQEGGRGDLQGPRPQEDRGRQAPPGRPRPEEIRPIACEVGVSPRTHGSGLFTRGQTQILSLLTLGTAKEGQRIDDLSLETGSPVHAPLQLPAVLGRGDRLHARPEAARHRPRCARAARSRR